MSTHPDAIRTELRASPLSAAAIAHATFGLLAPTSYKPDGSVGYSDPDVPAWLAADPRWLALCAERVRHERYGEGARGVLKHTDRKLTVAALDATQAKRPSAPKPEAKAPGDLLTQYLAGQHLDAWRRALAYPAITGDLRAEIDALANATMMAPRSFRSGPPRATRKPAPIDTWSAYAPRMIPLQDLTDILLPKLKADGVLPAIFPTPGGKGVIVPVDDVLSALDDELEQYE